MASILGQPVLVVNKPGAGGALGVHAVKAAPADGHTILLSPPPGLLLPIATKDIGYTLADFIPINLVGRNPSVLVVKRDAPWTTMDQLIADAKKNPGKFGFGSAGLGTSGHFAVALLNMETGAEFLHVPMKGEAPVATAIAGGHIHTSIIGLVSARSQLQAGNLRALAVTSPEGTTELPNVPSTAAIGYRSIEVSPWFIFFVRANTPPNIVGKLGKVFNQALQDKGLVERVENVGIVVQNRGPEETAKFLEQENKKWSHVGRLANIRATN